MVFCSPSSSSRVEPPALSVSNRPDPGSQPFWNVARSSVASRSEPKLVSAKPTLIEKLVPSETSSVRPMSLSSLISR